MNRTMLAKTCLGLALGFTVAGCSTYQAPVKPPMGLFGTNAFFITDIKAPLTIEFDGNPCGNAVKKVSHGETSYFFDFLLTLGGFTWDKAGVERIAKEGGLTKVSYADYEAFMVFGVFGKYTINVYGE